MTNNAFFKYIMRHIIGDYIKSMNIELSEENIEQIINTVNMHNFEDRELLDRMDINFIEKYLREKKLKKLKDK